LASDQPVYALQARGLDGQIMRDQSIEEMTRNYLSEIRTLQPAGPYFLGGFCFGGLLALEAAQQLLAAGEQVGLLIMIQTTHPASAYFNPSTSMLRRYWYRMVKRVDLERENLAYRGKGYILERARRAWDIACARGAIALDEWSGNGRPRRKNPSMPYILESITIENDKAAAGYNPRPYPGEVLLFRAHKQLSGLMTTHYLGWDDVFRGPVELCEIPGHQQNILLEPNVRRLAEEIGVRLKADQRRFSANGG